MRIKITYPVRIGDRVIQPGETIDAEEKDARFFLTNEWAAIVAEDEKIEPKKAVKHGK
jgi:hypothetical protein